MAGHNRQLLSRRTRWGIGTCFGTIAMVSTGCSSQAPTDVASATTSASTTAGVAITTATSTTVKPPPSTTTTTLSTTTSTTTLPVAATGSFTTKTGWTYTYNVVILPPSIERSPGQCVPAPPPGKVNLRLRLDLRNEATDRSAPSPTLVAASNISAAGNIMNPKPTGLLDIEGGAYEPMAPVEFVASRTMPGTSRCAGTAFGGIVEIPKGKSASYDVTIGSVPEVLPANATLALSVTTADPYAARQSAASQDAGWLVAIAPPG